MPFDFKLLSCIHIDTVAVGYIGNLECAKTVYLDNTFLLKSFYDYIEKSLGKCIGLCKRQPCILGKHGAKVGMIQFFTHSPTPFSLFEFIFKFAAGAEYRLNFWRYQETLPSLWIDRKAFLAHLCLKNSESRNINLVTLLQPFIYYIYK